MSVSVHHLVYHRYELQHLLRTHMGSDDESYSCIFQQEDSEGIRGVKLDRVLCSLSTCNLTLRKIANCTCGNQAPNS